MYASGCAKAHNENCCPSLVVVASHHTATVESYGQRREGSLLGLDERVRIGDYRLVQAGGFAYDKIPPERAHEALALLDELQATHVVAEVELRHD